MKLEHLRQLWEHVYTPRRTLKDVEDGLRAVFAADPVRAERAIGHMYGHVFKNREELYEARRGRK